MEKQREHTEQTKKRSIGNDGIVFGCICMLIVAFLLRRIISGYFDNDFFHIATSGRWMAQHGIMRQNPFFVEDGYRTIIQQWLYALLLWFAYRGGGYYGVFLFTLIQVVLLCGIGYAYLRIRSIKPRLAGIGALLFGVSVLQLNCRPEIISLLLFTAQMCVMEYDRKKQKKAVLYILPVLVLAEVNLHAAYAVFHFILLLPYLVPVHRLPICRELTEWCGIREEKSKANKFLLPILLMAAALFCNPYGIDAVLILLRSGNIRLLSIAELQPATILRGAIVLPVLGLLFMAIGIRFRKTRESTQLLYFGFLLPALVAEKNLLFFSIVLLAQWGDLFEDFSDTTFWSFLGKIGKGYLKVLAGLTAVLSAGLLLYGGLIRVGVTENGVPEFSNGLLPHMTDTEMYPVNAIAYILENEEHPEELRIMNTFNSGSAFLWNGIGHVYLEPKTEPYLKSVNGQYDIISEYIYIGHAAPAEQIEAFLNKYHFDYVFCSPYMQGLRAYLDWSDAYECVVVSECTIHDYEKETGNTEAAYYLYRCRY